MYFFPDQTFPNFKAWNSLDTRNLCSAKTSIGGFEGYKIVWILWLEILLLCMCTIVSCQGSAVSFPNQQGRNYVDNKTPTDNKNLWSSVGFFFAVDWNPGHKMELLLGF